MNKYGWLILLLLITLGGGLIYLYTYVAEKQQLAKVTEENIESTTKDDVDPYRRDDADLKGVGSTYKALVKVYGEKVDAVRGTNGVEFQFDNNETWFSFPYTVFASYTDAEANRIFELPVKNTSIASNGMSKMLKTWLPEYEGSTISQTDLSAFIDNFSCANSGGQGLCTGNYKEYNITIKISNIEFIELPISIDTYIMFTK